MGEYRFHRHAPEHLAIPGAVYMVTAGTYLKKPIFDSARKLELLQTIIHERSRIYGWDLQAWVVLNNHYHLIAQAPSHEAGLAKYIKSIHSKSAILVNRIDGVIGRKVWYNYWDTCIRTKNEYLARYKYILRNPERHGVVDDFRNYAYPSYSQICKDNIQLLESIILRSGPINLGEIDDY
jgi:putative transposase